MQKQQKMEFKISKKTKTLATIAFWRFRCIWRCARGGIRHAESESEVKNDGKQPPEAKKEEDFFCFVGHNSDTLTRIWTRLGGNASQESPAAF